MILYPYGVIISDQFLNNSIIGISPMRLRKNNSTFEIPVANRTVNYDINHDQKKYKVSLTS